MSYQISPMEFALLFFMLTIPGFSPASVGELETAVPGNGITPFAGAAYFSEQETLPGGSCLNSNREIEVGEARSSFSFQESLSEEKLQSELGFDAGTRMSFGLAGFSVAAGFVKASMSTDLSIGAAWESDYLFPTRSLQVTLEDLNATGRSALERGRWNETCGDRFVKELSSGGKLFFSVTIDFRSKEEKSAFQTRFSVSGGLFEASAALRLASRSFHRNTKVTVRGYQVGGDVSRITQLFPQTPDGRAGFIECQLGSFEKCAKVIESAVEYATDVERGFPSQLRPGAKPGPAILSFRTAPYSAIGIYPNRYPEIDDATRLARKRVGDAFREQYRNAVTVDRLLAARNLGEKQKPLQEARAKIDSNIGLLLNLAEICYTTPASCWKAVYPEPGRSALTLEPFDQSLLVPPGFLELCRKAGQSTLIANTVNKLRIALKSTDPASDCDSLERKLGDARRLEITGTGALSDELDLRLLSPFRQLEHLRLRGSRIVDVSLIADLEALKTLDLSNNHIVEPDSLGVLPDLTTLNLGLNHVRTLNGLDRLSRLRELSVHQNELASLSGFGFIPALQTIDLRQNPLRRSELEALKKRYPSTLNLLF